MDKDLAPWGKLGAGRVIAHNPKMSFLGFYQLILAFGVSRRNRPSVSPTKHDTGKKAARLGNETPFSVDSPPSSAGRGERRDQLID